MSFVFRTLMDAARDWVVFIQIAKCSDPRARTMGHTWFVWNALSCVYFSITECFGVAARRPDEIKHVNSIEVISLECVRTKTQLKRSAGAGKKNTPCVIIKNELALMSFCFVTRGCWNTWWQLALCKLNGNACSILYDHRDIKYQHGNYTK